MGQHATNVEIMGLEDYFKAKHLKMDVEMVGKDELDKNDCEQSSGPQSRLQSTFLRQPTLVKASEKHQVDVNAHLVIPKTPRFYLPPRDDAAEFDDSGPDLRGIVDDKSVVAWRKGNKAGVHLSAKINENLESGTEITTGFAMKFVYTNTVPALEQRVQTADVIMPVY